MRPVRPSRLPILLPALAGFLACGDGTPPTGPERPELPGSIQHVRVDGTVVTADGAAVASIEVLGLSDIDSVTVVTDSEGRFEVVVDRLDQGSLTIIISAAGDAADDYLPALRKFGAEDATTDLVAMLIPSRLTVPSGRFAGQEVEMSLQAAVAPENQVVENGNGNFFFLHRWLRPQAAATDPFAPGVDVDATRSFWTSSWNTARLPLPLYFERGPGQQGRERSAISPEDSVTIWSAIVDLEDRLGIDLLEPAEKSDIGLDTLQRPGAPEPVRLFAISLEMIPDLASPGTLAGFAGAEASCTTFAGDGCDRFGPGELIRAEVTLSSFVGSPPSQARWLVQHELTHALGFGHACFRPSVMAACSGPYSGVSLEAGDPNPLATAYDAAYVHWYRMIHERTLEVRPHFGIVEALDGERRHAFRRAPVTTQLRCNWGEPAEACWLSE